MIPLLAEGEPTLLPWGAVVPVVVGMAAAIIALWLRDLKREEARVAREQQLVEDSKKTVADSRQDGKDVTKAIVEATEATKRLVEMQADSREERDRVMKELSGKLDGIRSALSELTTQVGVLEAKVRS